MSKRVLVTGATGFVGRHCLEPLRARDYEVHGLTSGPRARPSEEFPGVEWHSADLLVAEPEAIISRIAPTHLLHCAWGMEPVRCYTSRDNFRWVRASLALLEAFVAGGGQRAVLLGSCAEYDWNAGFCSEAATPAVPATTYGECKLATGQLAMALARQSGLSCAWARLFFLYGPWEHPRRLVASVAGSLLRGEPARCSPGEQLRDYLHVQDAAEACVELLHSSVDGMVNVGSGDAVSVREIVTTIAELTHRPDLVRLGALPPVDEPPLVVAATQRLIQEVGWQPRFSLASGLEHTVHFWREELARSHDGDMLPLVGS